VTGPVLILAGGYEFEPYGHDQEAPVPQSLPFLAKVHELMGYDAAILTPLEEHALAAAKAPLPKSFTLVDTVKTRVLKVGDADIGLVMAPPLKSERMPPSLEEMNAVIDAAKALKPKVKLLIALTPWGIVPEKQLIDLGAGVFHVVLGSGQGSGLTGRLDADGRTAWVRAFMKGKALSEIRILAWPAGDDFKWISNQTVLFGAKALDDRYPEDQAVVDMLRPLNQEQTR
jgi:hypothetical protein